MSPIPKKKKTPEELAALRESLGIASGGPPADAPGVMGQGPIPPAEEDQDEKPVIESRSLPEPKFAPKKAVVPETVPDSEVELDPPDESTDEDEAVVLKTSDSKAAEVKPMRSFRKSKSLPVDKPKKAVSKESGKLPTRRHREGERIPLEKPTKPVSAGGAKLPTRKHTDRELAQLRKAPVPGVEAPVVSVEEQKLGLLGLVVVYGSGVTLMVLAGLGALATRVPRFDLPFDWLKNAVVLQGFPMILFGTMSAGVLVMLVAAAWIFFRKPISQHHAAILTLIAVLVLVFGTLYFFPGLHGA